MLSNKALPKTVKQLHALCQELQSALAAKEKALEAKEKALSETEKKLLKNKQPLMYCKNNSKPYRVSYLMRRSWNRQSVKGFQGVIVSDEHKPYNTLAKNYGNIKAHGGCWAHCRRNFSDAAKGRRHASEAHKILLMIAALYKQDDALKHLSGQAKIEARHKKVKPHLLQIKHTLDQYATVFVKQGLMNKAIRYARNNWPKFTAFLDHPELPLDNNPIERTIRPFTVGRRNWLFSGSPRGAAASAFLYSLIETAKANGWEPKAYLQTLFERYPSANNDEKRRALLPMFLKTSQ